MTAKSSRCILVPDDGSDFSEHALLWAIENIARPGDSFVLMQAFQVPSSPTIFIPEVDIVVEDQTISMRSKLQAAIKSRLEHLAEHLTRNKYPTSIEVVENDPRDAILDAIKEFDVDMVVMASRGKGALT
eukprot:Ihof_evm8s117 gene=Ihof_evmTU8s117